MGRPHAGSRVVEFERVSKAYGKVDALREVSFGLRSGEITALLGPNGAGKTTILEILSGLRRRDSGAVQVFGMDPAKQQKQIAHVLGVQVQEFNLQATVHVGEALSFFASLYSRPVSPEDLVRRFGLESKKKARFDSLSGGQKRRLAIAKALVGDPDMVVLDEPTSGLDPQGQQFLRAETVRLRDEGRGILLSTHDVADAERLADRVLIVNEGQIVADGSVERVIGDLCQEWKVEFASEVPRELAQRQSVQVSPSIAGVAFFEDRYEAESVAADHGVRGAQRATLSDAYFVATGLEVE